MRLAAALVLFLLCAPAQADSWAAAQVAAVASPAGQVVVRVLPGTDFGAVEGFAGSPRGKPATAVFYRLDPAQNYLKYQEVPLLNPVAPVFLVISDAGELATLDNWHNMGLGQAIAVYRADGTVLRSYELAEIYPKADLQKIRRSVSSLWWRCPSQPVFEPRLATLDIEDALGGIVQVNLKTGAVTRRPSPRKGC